MRFVFTKLFYGLLALGLIPLSLSWGRPALRWGAFAFDAFVVLAALIDWRLTQLPPKVKIERTFGGRFAVGAENDVFVNVRNFADQTLNLIVKDNYPPALELIGTRDGAMTVEGQTSSALAYRLKPPKRGRYEFGLVSIRLLGRFRLVWKQFDAGTETAVKVYPNMRRAREAELKALGARSLVSAHRRAVWRGEGRDFESLRDYVRGDELRHISWSATARRGKLVTRQYQIERDQTIMIALDAGRLMTGRIDNETKFDSAVHAALALMSAAARGGDNAGLMVFGRRVKAYIAPKRGAEHIDAALEALHAIEPEMIEPSYARAFAHVAGNTKRRALVVILTDLVDEEGSKELLASLRLMRPRHLPLVVTIADRDLRTAVRHPPTTVPDLFTQSVAEEILHQREAALRMVEAQGGLALDVTAATLAPSLLETYIRVKERGLL